MLVHFYKDHIILKKAAGCTGSLARPLSFQMKKTDPNPSTPPSWKGDDSTCS
jgi:hypothetical protein